MNVYNLSVFEYAWDQNNVVIPILALVREMISYTYLYDDGIYMLVIYIILGYNSCAWFSQ